MIQIINVLLVVFLIACALAIALSRKIVSTIILFSAYSAVMSLLWLLLFAPDVAMTEAAIGVGVNSVVFVAVLSRIRRVTT